MPYILKNTHKLDTMNRSIASTRPFLLISALALSISIASHNDVQAINIGYWNFNTLTPSPLNNANQLVYTPTSGADSTATLTLGGINSSATGGITNFAGTTINAVGSDPAGQALAIQGNSTGSGVTVTNNGGTLTLLLNLTGYVDPILTFATRDTATGFSNNQVSYSTDGTNFTNFGAAYNPTTTFALQTFDFSSVNALDGASSASFRITFDGATDGSGNNRLDNIQLNATAVPFDFDPSLGLLALGGVWTIRKMIKKSKSNIEK